MKIKANDPNRKSFIPVPGNSDFPIQNIPFGIYSDHEVSARPCVAIGAHIADLCELSYRGYLGELDIPHGYFDQPFLNELLKLGKTGMRELRDHLAWVLDAENPALRDSAEDRRAIFKEQREVRMELPVQVGDYTDFYSSIEHATNVGSMFRDPENALLPNWRHLPVAYHGRSSSIVVSGEAIHRPRGQMKPHADQGPVFGPCRQLDFELEMAFVTFEGKALGDHITVAEAEQYIFGLLLFNDWSARDIQKWEYVPLGPFLAKNFASTVSPWIVSLDALEPLRCAGPKQEPAVLPYLAFEGPKNLDIGLEVAIKPIGGDAKVVCTSNYKYMYWNMNQQLAHHTVNGCKVRAGDMMASGTISGTEKGSYGSMLELTWRGEHPLALHDGHTRKFIEDGDTVIMSGHGRSSDGVRIGFGSCSAKVLPPL